MDVDGNHDSNDKDMWEWREEYSLQTNSRNNFSHLLWDEVKPNEDDFLYMLEEQTPIKDCADFGCEASNTADVAIKGLEESGESSQLKRRRMLQFSLDANKADIGNEEDAATFLKSKVRECSMMEDGLSESLKWTSQWAVGFSDESCVISCEGLDQSSEGWLVDCLNENEMHCIPDEMNNYLTSNDQVSVSDDDVYTISFICLECNNILPEVENDVVQETPAPAPLVLYKGLKSCIKTPAKLTSSIAYPFSLIKPCGVQGDVTLNDINQRILAPRSSKVKHKKDEETTISYPTSAYSGKPVVVKTKICTEGGKGSITIMRTKG